MASPSRDDNNTPTLDVDEDVLGLLPSSEGDDNFDLTIGGETDLVERHFGHLGELERIPADAPEGIANLAAQRFERRRNLIELAHMPEGFEFLHRIRDGPSRAVILLTPPHLVSTLTENGKWERELRIPDVHGPAPYTEDWYQEYLRVNDLPTWFFTDEHLEAWDGPELALLPWGTDPRPGSARPDVPEYLELRYRAEPRYPMLNDSMYMVEDSMTLDQRARVARRFPALGVRGFDYDTFVQSTGHFFLATQADRSQTVSRRTVTVNLDSMFAWRSETVAGALASYYIQDPSTSSRSTDIVDAVDASRQARQEAQDDARAAGAFVNPDGDMQGLGEYRFITEHDEQLAVNLGFHAGQPEEFQRFRVAGGFANMPQHARPGIVWWPDWDLLNPVERPEGEGHFEFLTLGGPGSGSNEDLAALQFGGATQGYNLPARPSARQIWNLRQRDPSPRAAFDINIVWVPGQAGTPDTSDVESPSPSPPRVPSRPSSTTGRPPKAKKPINRISSEEQDPLNGGPPGGRFDQTGVPGRARYVTKEFNDELYTIDRGRCHAHHVEKHKLWVRCRECWRKYPQADTIVWTDKKSVEKLNKWRDQTLNRHDWPLQREKPRADYTDEQYKWLLEWVIDADGGKPKTSPEEITEQFNNQWPDLEPRNVSGITAVLIRLRNKYNAGGFDVEKRRRRGQNKKEEAEKNPKYVLVPKDKKRPRVVDESDDEEVLPKQAKKDEGEDGDEYK